MSNKQDKTISNTTIVLIMLAIFLVGVVSVQAVTVRNLKHTLYNRCTQAKPGNDSANEFRKKELEAFKLITMSPRIDDQTRQLYEGLAEGAQKAVDKYRPADCSIYR